MLRRLAVLSAAALSLAGCSNFRDLFSAHADVVARAAGQNINAGCPPGLLEVPHDGVERRLVDDRIHEMTEVPHVANLNLRQHAEQPFAKLRPQ